MVPDKDSRWSHVIVTNSPFEIAGVIEGVYEKGLVDQIGFCYRDELGDEHDFMLKKNLKPDYDGEWTFSSNNIITNHEKLIKTFLNKK